MLNPKLFQPITIDWPIDIPFTEYISECQKLITSYRLDLNSYNSEKIIQANSPFELSGDKPIGALLIHGLLDSPFIMRDIASHLKALGVCSKAILLPGHGLTPGALLNVTYQDWLKTLAYGIKEMKQSVDKIILIGFSTGANLALIHHFLNDDPALKGMILIAPALKLHSPLAFLLDWHNKFNWMYPGFQWLSKTNEIDSCRYRSVCFNAGFQVKRTSEIIRSIAKKNIPLLMSIAEDDHVVNSKACLDYFKQYGTADSRFLLYSKNNLSAPDQRISIRKACYPELNIRNFSHIALTIQPQNYYYGINGEYLKSINLSSDKNFFYDTDDLSRDFSKPKPKQDHVIRLTFNPDFDFFKIQIAEFIDTCKDN